MLPRDIILFVYPPLNVNQDVGNIWLKAGYNNKRPRNREDHRDDLSAEKHEGSQLPPFDVDAVQSRCVFH